MKRGKRELEYLLKRQEDAAGKAKGHEEAENIPAFVKRGKRELECLLRRQKEAKDNDIPGYVRKRKLGLDRLLERQKEAKGHYTPGYIVKRNDWLLRRQEEEAKRDKVDPKDSDSGESSITANDFVPIVAKQLSKFLYCTVVWEINMAARMLVLAPATQMGQYRIC